MGGMVLFFLKTNNMTNVNLPKDAVFDEAMLHDLCNRDWYRISFGSVAEWNVSIRYVLDENCFGYKPYGQFLVSEFSPEEYDFYVFDTNEMWEEDHNESICDDFFHGQPHHIGYAHRVLFAGMRTAFKDDFGDDIYTGDIVWADKNPELIFPVDKMLNSGEPALMKSYNEAIPLKESKSLIRVGTVFNDLDWSDPMSLCKRNVKFLYEAYGEKSNLPRLKRMLTRAQITPSFMQNYEAYELMSQFGEKYGWRNKWWQHRNTEE